MGLGGFSGLRLTSVAVSVQPALGSDRKRSSLRSAKARGRTRRGVTCAVFNTGAASAGCGTSLVEHQDLFVATEAGKSDESRVFSPALMSATK